MYNQFKLMEKYFFVYRTAFVRLAILIPLTVYFACDNAYSPSYTIPRCTCCYFNMTIAVCYVCILLSLFIIVPIHYYLCLFISFIS